MKIEITEQEGLKIAEILSDQILIRDVQDALDLMAEVRYLDSDRLILQASHLDPLFFDLKTRLAGDILQKFSNYRMYLAIVGDFSDLTSGSLKDFISESNKFGRINFVGTVDEAKASLAKK